MELTTIKAKTLSEAWFLCVYKLLEGFEYCGMGPEPTFFRDGTHLYTISRGSHEESQRLEFDSVTVHVEYPGSRPLVPDVPEGVPPPTSMDAVESYLPYLMTGDKKQNELYTYGEDIDRQLPELVKILREGGQGTNQACMSVGSSQSIFLEHSQCLRVIDTRIQSGRLHFYVYFRSWDLWGGFPANLAAIQVLKEYVASEVGVEDGELVAYSKGLHLYSHQWEVAKRLLRR